MGGRSSKTTTLTFYGGLDEIGGNKILLEDKGTRVFLDFGKSFATRSKFFEWTESPRVANGVGDFLALGILPDIEGIYRRDLLRLARRPNHEERSVDGIVLSHAHSDHADYISFLREDIPVWMGETCRDVIEAIEEEKSANVEFEITKFKERPIDRKADPVSREVNTFRSGNRFKIDSIEIEPVHVDHSLPGCYGFIVTTSSCSLVYSGDLRIHGNRPDLTMDFIERSREVKPDWMLCEGTRITEASSSSENEVYSTCFHYVGLAENDLFIFADYSYKDIDRFVTFHRVARETGRIILIPPKTARYLSRLATNNPDLANILPRPNDPTIGIYKNRLKSGTYSDDDYDYSDLNFFRQTNVWTADDVAKDSSKVIMAIGSHQLDELIDLKPRKGIFLHSSSEPFNEEGELNEKRTRAWTDRFGLVKVQAHCSGHASGRELNRIVDEIRPRKIIPIHTEHAGIFETFHGSKVVRVPLGAYSVELD